MLNRRKLLVQTAGFAVLGLSLGKAAAGSLPGIDNALMRGSINAADFGVQPGALDDQSKAFAGLLREANDRDIPVFLPPGTYVVSNLSLPSRIRLSGVPGASRIAYGGNGHLLMAEQAEHIEFTGLVFEGTSHWMGDYARGLLDLRHVAHLVIDNCRITGSGKSGVALEHASGRIERSEISGAADAGIYSVEAAGLEISGNTVSDCANGGILVHRWRAAEDGTIVSGNRVERIQARSGGTGQNGNGINAFRAGSVVISGNIVSDCAFSAIRANSASNLHITGNTCSRSGETALYSEFSFEGAIVSNNIVDGAANGISIVNFNEGGAWACVPETSSAISRPAAPTLPMHPASASVSTSRRIPQSPATSLRMHRSTACTSAGGRSCAMWSPREILSARPEPASPSPWSRVLERRSSPTMSSTAPKTARSSATAGPSR